MPARSALLPYRDARDLLLSKVMLAAAESVSLDEALGRIFATDVVVSQSLPSAVLAGRRGIAVASRDLVGASPYTPALLTVAPALILHGDPLPQDADAVIEEEAVVSSGGFHDVGQSAYPGEGAILPGADLVAGTRVAAAGTVATPATLLALALAGVTHVSVRSPAIAIEGDEASPASEWLRATLASGGCRIAREGALRVVVAHDPQEMVRRCGRPLATGLALNPGRDIAIADDDGTPILVLPRRFDAVVAACHALIVPALAAMTGRVVETIERPLLGKIVSRIGFAELALLRIAAAGYEPLAAGHVPLAALIAADAVAIVEADSEGAPAGPLFAATPIGQSRGSS